MTPLPYAGFCATRSMSANPCAEKASRPFDKTGTDSSWAKGPASSFSKRANMPFERRAKIYAELVGYGNTADAFHFTAPEPDGDGMIRVMKAALEDAAVEPGDVGYINAHGTSTPMNDKIESAAIMNVFGDHAAALKVSSIKSMIGHLLAAAGAVEFIATVMSVHERHPAADDQLPGARPGMSPGLRDRWRRSDGVAACRQQFVRFRRGQRLPGRKEISRKNRD